MTNNKNIDINKQIIIEKGNFLINNSTFFYKNLKEFDIELKMILLNPAPLEQCPEYTELVEEINKYKGKNTHQLNYQYSLEILFHIVNLIRLRSYSSEQIELIRSYIKYISTRFSEQERTLYHSKQNSITINIQEHDEAKKHMRKK